MAVLIPVPAPSISSLQEEEANKTLSWMNNGYDYSVDNANAVFNAIWQNNQGLTPQQVFAGLGVNGGLVRTFYTSLASYLNQLSPGSVNLVEPNQVVVNPDGSVTVGAVVQNVGVVGVIKGP